MNSPVHRCLAAFLVLFCAGGKASAAFHLMRIEEVMAGVGGNADIQFVELQMTFAGQNFVAGHRVEFYDAAGRMTGSVPFMANVANGQSGASILVGTQKFSDLFGVPVDLVIPPGSIRTDGRVCFAGSTEDPCVSYGQYTGSMRVGFFDYVAPAPALPLDGFRSLKRIRTAFPFNNSTDFVLDVPDPRNNAGQRGSLPPDALPACALQLSETRLQPGEFTFADGTASTVADPFFVVWEVAPPDGVTVRAQESLATAIDFARPGTFTVRLTLQHLRQGSFLRSTCEQAVVVGAPICRLALDGGIEPDCLLVGSPLTVDGAGSGGPEPLSFAYEVIPPGALIQPVVGSRTRITFDTPGVYVVRQRVANAQGESSCVATVCVVASLLPTCNLDLTGPSPPLCLFEGGSIQVDGSRSSGPDVLSFRYEVSPPAGVTVDPPGAARASISFADPGSYQVRLIVSNRHGESACEAPVCVEETPTGDHRFKRGNCNGDVRLDISDGVAALAFLFVGGEEPPCRAACDANRDQRLDLSDGIYILSFLFTGAAPPDPPYPDCEATPAAQCLRETCAASP